MPILLRYYWDGSVLSWSVASVAFYYFVVVQEGFCPLSARLGIAFPALGLTGFGPTGWREPWNMILVLGLGAIWSLSFASIFCWSFWLLWRQPGRRTCLLLVLLLWSLPLPQLSLFIIHTLAQPWLVPGPRALLSSSSSTFLRLEPVETDSQLPLLSSALWSRCRARSDWRKK